MESSGYRGPINPNPGDGESSVIIYGYIPSRALATIALVSFGLVALNYLSILARFKQSRAFNGLMVFGCVRPSSSSLSLSSRPACTTRPTDSLPPCRSARLLATQRGSSRTTTPTSSSTSSCVLVHLDSSALF